MTIIDNLPPKLKTGDVFKVDGTRVLVIENTSAKLVFTLPDYNGPALTLNKKDLV